MDENQSNVLIIRHLPNSLSSEDKQDLLKHFGASHVRCLGDKGRMKHTAFASFNNYESAQQALHRLHQLDILGHSLVVEFAKTSVQRAQAAPSIDDRFKTTLDDENADDEKTQKKERNTGDGKALGIELANNLMGIAPSMHGSSDPHLNNGELILYMFESKASTSIRGFTYPLNPKLRYRYPPPTVGVLTNIINSLASCPRFYTQVLHLMNKMNLPAPFGMVTPGPPLREDEQQLFAGFEAGDSNPAEMDVSSSSEESEIESDEDRERVSRKVAPGLKRPSKKAKVRVRKRPRLQQLLLQVAPPKTSTSGPGVPLPTAAQVFEQPQQDLGKKPEFRIADSIAFALEKQREKEATANELDGADIFTNHPSIPELSVANPEEEVSGFGTFEPPPKPTEEENELEDEEEEDDDDDDKGTDFISRSELSKNRLSSREIKSMSVYKKYDRGEPTLRLYLKNLAKQVEEKDLKFIYGRYLDWESPIDKDMFTIQLMKQGRMKGQAFVGLPSEYAAKKALRDTNGYLLYDKPMVVQFARSAKPKPAEEGKKKK